MRSLARLILPALLASTACLPYTVGSTAQTVPTGKTVSGTTWYFIPNAVKEPGDTIAHPLAGVDREWRHGLDARSDVGLRLTSGAGVVVNYKQRVRDAEAGGPALAYMLGTGIVNAGQHAHFEATLIASGNEASEMTPYGGVRAMQVVPITEGARRDDPSLGVFGGVSIGDASFTLRPELAIYYDRSTLGLRKSSFIVVPAVTMSRGRSRTDHQEAASPRSGPMTIACMLIRCF